MLKFMKHLVNHNNASKISLEKCNLDLEKGKWLGIKSCLKSCHAVLPNYWSLFGLRPM